MEYTKELHIIAKINILSNCDQKHHKRTQLSSRMHVATIQVWTLFLSLSSRCSNYSRVATILSVASIRINTVFTQ